MQIKTSGGGTFETSNTVILREDLMTKSAYESIYPGRMFYTADGRKHQHAAMTPNGPKGGYDVPTTPSMLAGGGGLPTQREAAENIIAANQDLVARLKQFGKDEYEDQTVLYITATYQALLDTPEMQQVMNAKEFSLRKYYGGETVEDDEPVDTRKWYTYVLVKDSGMWLIHGTFHDLPRQRKHWGELVEEIFSKWADCEIQVATDFEERPLITDGRALRRL